MLTLPRLSSLACLALSTALTFPATALAQSPDDTGDETLSGVTDPDDMSLPDGIIVVTGTRIKRVDEVAAGPLVSYSEEDIRLSGETDLADLLSQSPALVNSRTDFDFAGDQAAPGTAGLNLLDLRNLGTDRTLVLVNGRRHVGSLAGQTAVDINSIPNSLVERVDILTGGMSAIYGADGVSGVVNFVTKRDFEGFDLTLQKGISDEGDAGSTLISAVAGKNFADGRGNIALAYDYRKNDRLSISDRAWGKPGAKRLVSNPAGGPDNILVGDLRFSGGSPNGAVYLGLDNFPTFDGNGDLYDRGISGPYILQGTNTAAVIGGSGTPVADYGGDLQPKKEAHIFNMLASYEFTPALRFFVEGKYARNESYTEAAPSFSQVDIPFYNPFIPDNIAAALAPFEGVFVVRDNFDFGRLNETAKRDLYRGVIGLDGDLTDNLRFELSYTYGRTDATITDGNYIIGDRYFAALDAVDEGFGTGGAPNGNIVCLSDLYPSDPINPANFGLPAQTFTPGDGSCQPLNIFGNGAPSQAALDFILADIVNRSRLQQHVVTGYVSGDFGDAFALPGGPIGFAIGGEYRAEKSRFDPDPLAQQSLSVDPTSSVFPDYPLLPREKGDFDVIEGFAELNAPILSDMPYAHRLEVEGALRVSDYSTVGTTTSWKLGGLYAPVRDITFRGSYSHAVRAPNIAELYTPRTGTFVSLADPCAAGNLGSGASDRAANCDALLASLGVAPGAFDPNGGPPFIGGQYQGNADLKEEEARTWTAGLFVQPQFLPGLSASFDWYDIRIKDAINTATPQQFVNLCVDQPSIDNAFCSNITRDATAGFITGFAIAPQNVAALETAGADMTLSYSFDTASVGAFNLRGSLGYLDKLTFLAADGAEKENRRGVLGTSDRRGSPKWVGTGDITWRMGPVLLNYGLNYIGERSYFTREELAANPDIADADVIKVDAGWTHDIRAEFITDGGMSFYFGANNFTNEKPDAPLLSEPVGYLGRYFYAGIRASFDGFGF